MVLEDNPNGLLRYEGDPLPTFPPARRARRERGGASDFVVYLGTFSKILSPGVRLGWAVAPRPVLEKLNLCKQGADRRSCPSRSCSWRPISRSAQARAGGVAAGAARDGRRRAAGRAAAGRAAVGAPGVAEGSLSQPPRRDAGGAPASTSASAATWTEPQGGLFIWATLPDYIDTTDLLARALESEAVAFVPGRAAYLDGRGASSMRLNFAGVPEEDIREGIRRIGKVVREQVGLFGTLTGAEPAVQPRNPRRRPPATPPRPGRGRASCPSASIATAPNKRSR